jgi:PIN domain nuclease of toxin-antitoxin system
VFLWSVGGSGNLSQAARSILEDPTNTVFVSVISAWEISIKFSRGRLDIPDRPESYVPDMLREFGYQVMPVMLPHTLQIASMAELHRDPFDRMLIAQAQVEGLPIVTSDANIARYDVQVIW